jgi:hypothetical protein
MEAQMRVRTVEVHILPDGRMDRKNAAAYLGLSGKTLAMYAGRQTGPPFVRLAGRVFYFRDHLDDWLGLRRRRAYSEAEKAMHP